MLYHNNYKIFLVNNINSLFHIPFSKDKESQLQVPL